MTQVELADAEVLQNLQLMRNCRAGQVRLVGDVAQSGEVLGAGADTLVLQAPCLRGSYLSSEEIAQITPTKHRKSLRRNTANYSDGIPQITPTCYTCSS